MLTQPLPECVGAKTISYILYIIINTVWQGRWIFVKETIYSFEEYKKYDPLVRNRKIVHLQNKKFKNYQLPKDFKPHQGQGKKFNPRKHLLGKLSRKDKAMHKREMTKKERFAQRKEAKNKDSNKVQKEKRQKRTKVISETDGE